MKENRPKIRFKGFNEEWHKEQLKSLANYKSTGIRSFDISDSGLYDLYDANEIIGKVNTYAFESSYISIIKDGSGVGRVRIMPKMTNILGTMGCISPNNMNDNYFIYCLLQNTDFKKHIISGAIPHVYFSNYGEDIYNVAKQSEQQKIGEYFRQLDELISAKEQKLAKLRQMKMAMLDKMFPKEGENTPAIRFHGFTGPWEQSIISSIFDLDLPHYSLSRDKLNLEKGDVLNIHYGDILIKFGDIVNVGKDIIPFISSSSSENYKNSKLINGDIIFADTAEDETCGKAIEIQNIENQTVVAGLHTFVARPQITFASKFLGYYFNSNSYHSQLVPLMQGIKVLSISKSTIEQTIVYYPKDLDEQLKIGEFFHNMDTSINSLSEQITKLKDIKQACLSQMFA